MFLSGMSYFTEDKLLLKMRNQVLTNYCSDIIIWNSFRNGDKAAFATLYYRYFDILVHNCFQYSKDIRIIEDCIHDLFLEIWNSKMNLATPTSVKAYLLCSTQRKIIRQVKRSRNLPFHSDHELTSATIASIEDKLISEQVVQERKTRIRYAISKLTERQKQAVRLRYFENLSSSEIANIMKISKDSVYNLVSKALENIQKNLQKADHKLSAFLN